VYRLINEYAETVIGTIPRRDVTEYDWLLQNVGEGDGPAYQQRYRAFWRMNVARLSPDFHTAYFSALSAARRQAPTLAVLCHQLYDASARGNGTRSLQFSFLTKLLHTTNPRLPIYDSKVAAFYFFEGPPTEMPLDERIGRLVAFYDFLHQEYARVLSARLLGPAIETFRERLKPEHHTDEKCIDWLLWAFVILLERGGLASRQIAYR
jgi:hypothetical protein